MFEKMKNNVTRIPGNLKKLNQYQKDIDHLSKLFSEQQLLELMTTTESRSNIANEACCRYSSCTISISIYC